MKILFASSEMVPYSKTGGLADVAGALPDEIAGAGHEVVCITPLYKCVSHGEFELEDTEKRVTVELGEKFRTGRIYELNKDLPAKRWFMANDAYFDREELYQTPAGDFPDNAERFIFFARSILEAARAMEFRPDIIHLNDWQTSLAAVFLESTDYAGFFDHSRTLLTVHNLGYQGLFWHWDWDLTNLDWTYFTPENLEFYEKINFLKGGIIYADAVNTVSKKYAKEIQTEELGHGLEGVLLSHSGKVSGILNGIDTDIWNPKIDQFIAAPFNVSNLAGKKKCKADLQKIMGLPPKPDVPLFGVITRLDVQKGIELIIDAIDALASKKVQFIILGTGADEYEKALLERMEKFPDSVAVKIAYSNELAHKIEAGCDFFLMPSKYEPCGLNQMYSLMYGTVPVVRATGGLDDTIRNFSEKSLKGNGIKFRNFDSNSLKKAMKKAMAIYSSPESMEALVKNCLASDFSWKRSAKEYIRLYRKLLRS